MALYEYKKGEHPAGFIGIRLVRPIEGKTKQIYFNFRCKGKKCLLPETQIEELKTQAKIKDFELSIQQDVFLKRKKDEAKELRPRSPYITGVRGVKMKFIIDKKKGDKTWYSPAFNVYGSEKGIRFHRTFRIKKLGFENAWKDAVCFYANVKNIQHPERLLNRMPSPNQFLLIYKYQCGLGWDIPLSAMPLEIG